MKKVIRLTESDLVRLVRRVIKEQKINFRVIGIKMERDGFEPLVILRVQDWGSGERFINIEKQGKDLQTAYNTAIKEFESQKDLKKIEYPGIESVVPPSIDKLQAK